MPRRLIKIYSQALRKPYRIGFRYLDTDGPKEVLELYRYFSYADFAVGLLRKLDSEVPNFMSKVAEVDDRRFMASPHKTRRYIADNRSHLYINSPHLTEKFSRRLGSHWIATNIGRPEMVSIISAAAAAAGVARLPFSKFEIE